MGLVHSSNISSILSACCAIKEVLRRLINGMCGTAHQSMDIVQMHLQLAVISQRHDLTDHGELVLDLA